VLTRVADHKIADLAAFAWHWRRVSRMDEAA
jgi:hypothetical protein